MRFWGCTAAGLLEKDDSGLQGKRFERAMLTALDLLGMAYARNNDVGGPLWDLKATGVGWSRLVKGRPTNIKVSGTKWGFSDAVLVTMLPWQSNADAEPIDADLLARQVKAHLDARGLDQILWLRPKDENVQAAIELAAGSGDIARLTALLQNPNFTSTDFKGYSVKVLPAKDDPSRVGSVAIIVGGKVAMRSEAPRVFNNGNPRIGFRVEAKPSTTPHPIKARTSGSSSAAVVESRVLQLIEERVTRNRRGDDGKRVSP